MLAYVMGTLLVLLVGVSVLGLVAYFNPFAVSVRAQAQHIGSTVSAFLHATTAGDIERAKTYLLEDMTSYYWGCTLEDRIARDPDSFRIVRARDFFMIEAPLHNDYVMGATIDLMNGRTKHGRFRVHYETFGIPDDAKPPSDGAGYCDGVARDGRWRQQVKIIDFQIADTPPDEPSGYQQPRKRS